MGGIRSDRKQTIQLAPSCNTGGAEDTGIPRGILPQGTAYGGREGNDCVQGTEMADGAHAKTDEGGAPLMGAGPFPSGEGVECGAEGGRGVTWGSEMYTRGTAEHNRQGRVWKAAGINTWYKVAGPSEWGTSNSHLHRVYGRYWEVEWRRILALRRA